MKGNSKMVVKKAGTELMLKPNSWLTCVMVVPRVAC